jgi:hypothetical protein
MGGFQVVLAVLAVNACVLAAAFFALYLLNNSVSKSGQ